MTPRLKEARKWRGTGALHIGQGTVVDGSGVGDLGGEVGGGEERRSRIGEAGGGLRVEVGEAECDVVGFLNFGALLEEGMEESGEEEEDEEMV